MHVQVEAQLRGDVPFPWEAGSLRSDTRRQLGVFRKPVLELLRRDPAERASSQDFCAACLAIVSKSTTTTTAFR